MKYTIAVTVGILVLSATSALAECGIASTYNGKGPTGGGPLAANGERINFRGMTAAHRTLAFGTRVRVRNPRTGRTITVRINDRGPFIRGRIIDLTPAAMGALGGGYGLMPVCISH